MCLLVVVFTKTKRVYRHTADIHISSTTCWVLLAIRHENDAEDAAALVLAAVEDLEAGLEAAFHVGVAVSTQFFFDDFLELFLGGPGHDPQRALPVSFNFVENETMERRSMGPSLLMTNIMAVFNL